MIELLKYDPTLFWTLDVEITNSQVELLLSTIYNSITNVTLKGYEYRNCYKLHQFRLHETVTNSSIGAIKFDITYNFQIFNIYVDFNYRYHEWDGFSFYIYIHEYDRLFILKDCMDISLIHKKVVEQLNELYTFIKETKNECAIR